MAQERKKRIESSEPASPVAETKHRRIFGKIPKPPQLSWGKRTLFATIVIVAFFAGLEGLLWGLGVKTDLEASDRYAGFVSHVPHFVARSQPGSPALMEIAPHKKHVLNDISFAQEKPPGTFRIVCLGGSTTFGRPFFDQTSFPGWLRLWLPVAAPSQKWEVINAGAISYASYRELGLMEELAKYQPDLFILYLGQNEFLERRTYDELLKQPAWFREVASLTGHTRTASLIRRGLEDVEACFRSASTAPILPSEVKSIPVDEVGPEAYHRDAAFGRDVVAHFVASLDRMLTVADGVDARVMLVVPASNLADFAPLKSEPATELTAEEQRHWQQHFDEALRLTQQAKFAEALGELDAAAAIDDGRADLHFARGQLLMGLNRDEEAAEALRRAGDEDVCPLRATGPILAAVRQVVGPRDVLSIDLETLLAQRAPHGIPGKTQFHDHVHLTIESNRLLAWAIIEQLAAAGLAHVDPSWSSQVAERVAARYEAQWDRPRMARELLRLSSLLIKLKQPVMAIEQLQLALEFAAESDEVATEAGKLLDRVAGGNVTLKVLQHFVAVHPDSATARCQLGVALLRRRHAKEALSAFDATLELDPDQPLALNYAGLLNAEAGNLANAESLFRRLILVAPQLAKAHENLGLVVAKQGRPEEALAHYDEAMKLDPSSASAHRNAALACEQLGQMDEARRHREFAEKLKPAAAETKSGGEAPPNPR